MAFFFISIFNELIGCSILLKFRQPGGYRFHFKNRRSSINGYKTLFKLSQFPGGDLM